MITASKTFNEQLEELAEEYMQVMNVKSINPYDVAVWAIQSGRFKPYPQDIVKLLQTKLTRALRSIHTEDPQGRSVRKHYAVPVYRDKQLCFEWYKIGELDYEQMKSSLQYRRSLTGSECRQQKNDMDSWNENYSTGRLIQMSWNFDNDLLESEVSDTHPDFDDDDFDL